MTKWRCKDTDNGATTEKKKISVTASNWGDVIKDRLRTRRGHEVLVALTRENRKEVEKV